MTRRRPVSFNDNHRRQLIAEGWVPGGPKWVATDGPEPTARSCGHHHPTEASGWRCAKARGYAFVHPRTFERTVVPPAEHVTAPEDWAFLVLAAVFVWWLFQ